MLDHVVGFSAILKLPAVGTTQQGSVGIIYNIKSRVKEDFQAQLAPNDFGGYVRGLG